MSLWSKNPDRKLLWLSVGPDGNREQYVYDK